MEQKDKSKERASWQNKPPDSSDPSERTLQLPRMLHFGLRILSGDCESAGLLDRIGSFDGCEATLAKPCGSSEHGK